MKEINICITPDSRAKFINNAAYCVGTGRMDLALHREYQEQLAMAQQEAGFQHIRGHGIFSDGMAIYQPYTDEEGVEHPGYNFTYLDRVMDDYLRLGLKPFLELGFMPEKMASGTQTIFYWKGNTTPPKDDELWTGLVKATLRHLAQRYGTEEVSTWPCEVWNEPNLPGFWENADKQKYLHLYKITSRAVKEALPGMRVGGPAICGGAGSQEWVRDFLAFCRAEQLPLDFVTRHAYMGNTPQHKGRYLYHIMSQVENVVSEMQQTRDIIDSFPEYRGMDMHITEFNTSYNPFCPIHDTNLNAAYIAGLLARLGDVAASYSYWTFGDVFEEQGVPSRVFHGGFGMIANGLIAKPTLWTFAFFNQLKGEAVYRSEHMVLVKKAEGQYEGVAWNLCREGREQARVKLCVPCADPMVLLTRTVDEECCNPLKIWHDMGEPEHLSRARLDFLRKAGQPLCESCRVEGGMAEIVLKENAVVHFTLEKAECRPDYGYDYTWYQTHA